MSRADMRHVVPGHQEEKMKSKAWTEKFMQGVFFVAACASVLAVALISIFLFAKGIPAM